MITIPTITQLYNDIINDIETEFDINIPTFGKNYLRAAALAQAGRMKIYYLAIANLQKNIFVDTAESEAIGGTLERFGRVKLNRNPFAATAGQYTLQITGTVGAEIAASSTWKSNDDSTSPGKLFMLDLAYTLTSVTDSITVRALEGGLDSRLSIGDELSVTAPIAGVNTTATVTAEVVVPLAAEDLEDYRQDALDAYRLEPQGGAATDYRLWSFDAQGVQQVYPYAKSGAANEINLYVEATIADSSDGKGTPTQAILDAVEEVVEFDPDTTKPLNQRGRRPLGVFQIHYLPVTVLEVDITITGFSGITATIQAAILAALDDEINSIRPFVAAADILEDRNDTLSTNTIISTILNARPGSVFGAITLEVDDTQYTSFQFLNGYIPNLRNITYN